MDASIGFPGDGMDDNGWKLWIAAVVMVICSGLFVIWRCAVRLSTRQFGVDDCFIIAAEIFSIILTITVCESVANGYGRHIKDIPKWQLSIILEWAYGTQLSYKMTLICYKVGLLLFYKRIFITKWFKIGFWTVLSIVSVWGTIVMFVSIFQCTPVQAAWDTNIKGKCWNSDEFWVAFAASDVATDVLVMALPLPFIAQLHLAFREKILLVGVFLVGSFVVVTSIVRATIVVDALQVRLDYTYTYVDRNIWSQIEANVGIICTCLPILKSPFFRAMHATFGSSKRSTSRATSHNLEPTGDQPRSNPYKPSWTDRQAGGILRTQESKVDYDYEDQAPIPYKHSGFTISRNSFDDDDDEKEIPQYYAHAVRA